MTYTHCNVIDTNSSTNKQLINRHRVVLSLGSVLPLFSCYKLIRFLFTTSTQQALACVFVNCTSLRSLASDNFTQHAIPLLIRCCYYHFNFKPCHTTETGSGSGVIKSQIFKVTRNQFKSRTDAVWRTAPRILPAEATFNLITFYEWIATKFTRLLLHTSATARFLNCTGMSPSGQSSINIIARNRLQWEIKTDWHNYHYTFCPLMVFTFFPCTLTHLFLSTCSSSLQDTAGWLKNRWCFHDCQTH